MRGIFPRYIPLQNCNMGYNDNNIDIYFFTENGREFCMSLYVIMIITYEGNIPKIYTPTKL